MSFGGSPNFAFGKLGVANVSFDTMSAPQGGIPFVTAEAVQGDGKVVVVGNQTVYLAGSVPSTQSFAATRLNLDGSVDASFGTGGGATLFTTGGSAGMTQAEAVAIQPDGKVVLAGEVGGKPTVARLNANGSVDTTFGTAGSSTFAYTGATTSTATRLALQPDGKIVVAGSAQSTGLVNAAVARFNANGMPDTGFGTNGVSLIAFGGTGMQTTIPAGQFGAVGLVVQPDGKIVVASTSPLASVDAIAGLISPALARLNADGTPDTTFGRAGEVTLTNAFVNLQATSTIANSLAIQPDGKFLLAGTTTYSVAALAASPRLLTVPFVARLLGTGAPDLAFGTGGSVIGPASQSLGSANGFANIAVAVQPDGKIVLAGGDVQNQANGQLLGTAVVRLNPNGTPDNAFGTSGQTNLTYANQAAAAQLALRPDGTILVGVGTSVVGLLPRGAANDFNNDGISDPAVYLPNYATFAYRPSGGAPDVLTPFGIAGAGRTLPAPGAYDGSGVTELGVFFPASSIFAYRPYAGGPDVFTAFGPAGRSIPAPADYDGSGKTELGVYIPSIGAFAYRPANGGADTFLSIGGADSIPTPGDYLGTGHATAAVYSPSLGAFLINTGAGANTTVPFGIPGAGQSIPMPGDYDGSGRTELAVYLPSLGLFAYRPANGGPDQLIAFGAPGAGQTLPMPGDYDGSGHTELGVYLPSYGVFAYRPASARADVLQLLGVPGPGQTLPFTAAPSTVPTPNVVSLSTVGIASIPATPAKKAKAR